MLADFTAFFPTIAILHTQPITEGGTLQLVRSQLTPDQRSERLTVELLNARAELVSSYAVHAESWKHDVELLTGIAIVGGR